MTPQKEQQAKAWDLWLEGIYVELCETILPMSQEIVYYQDGNVTVTNARLIVPGKSYMLGHVTSVGVVRLNYSAEKFLGYMFAMISLPFLLVGILGSSSFGFITGFFLLVVGILMARSKDRYALQIAAASGEHQALIDTDAPRINHICHVLNEVIVSRSSLPSPGDSRTIIR